MAPTGSAAAPAGKNLTRKVAIVTGAASGFGEAVSRQLAARGAIVVLVDRDEVRGEKLSAELDEKYGGELDIGFYPFVKCDLSSGSGVKAAFDEAIRRFGSFDVVINNAGLADGDDSFFDFEARSDDWSKMVRVNVDAVVYGTQLAIAEFRETGKSGIVINTASNAAWTPLPMIPVYAATKAAVYHLGRSLGTLYPNISVFSICPGAVATNLKGASKVPGISDFNTSKAIQRGMALMQTDDVADAMMYCIDHSDELPKGCGITVSPPGIAILETETKFGRKIKDVRKREGGQKL